MRRRAVSRSSRRFTIGATDGIAAVVLPPLLTEIRRAAPAVDVRVRHLMSATAPASLDAREVDVAIVPLDTIPARFAARALYEEDFVVAMRAGHKLGPNPSPRATARRCTCSSRPRGTHTASWTRRLPSGACRAGSR
jgi:DNA-binding transcriptional LysR family regulator